MVSASFQNMQKTDDVGIDIAVRVFERIAHARLRRQIDDAIRLVRGKYPLNAMLILQVALLKLEICGIIDPRKPSVF